jgi:hypothetical protein
MNTHIVRKSISPLILSLGNSEESSQLHVPAALPLGISSLAFLSQEAERTPQPVWPGYERRIASACNRIPDRPGSRLFTVPTEHCDEKHSLKTTAEEEKTKQCTKASCTFIISDESTVTVDIKFHEYHTDRP